MHSLSPLETVRALRNEVAPDIDLGNSNPYSLVAREKDGTHTAYCFGTPIYEKRSGRLLDLRFRQEGNGTYLTGSAGCISVTEDVRMANEVFWCHIGLPGVLTERGAKVLRGDGLQIYPTTNGLVYQVACAPRQTRRVTLTVNQPFLNTRSNDRSFALMQEEHSPALVASCIGVIDAAGQILAPVQLQYQKLTDDTFALDFTHHRNDGQAVLYEINLYEPKLFQDTTVESAQPRTNNVFGTVAFLGDTTEYGRQWLYSRPDLSKVQDMMDRKIHQVNLHIPMLNSAGGRLTVCRAAQRFCSFGSRWDNKVEAAGPELLSTQQAGYHSMDITRRMTDPNQYLTQAEGLILRSCGTGCSIVATGDSCYAPQILEIRF